MIFNLHWIDLLVIIGYFAGMAAMGWYFMRRQKTTSEFLLASRDVGMMAIGLSLLSSLNSANDYVVGPAGFLEFGFIGFFGLLPVLLTYPIIFNIFIPFYQRLRVYNCYEYLEMRFDMRVRLVASFIFILWRMCWVATTLYSPAFLLCGITELPLIPTIVALGVVTMLYTAMGGQRAVVWTDVAQSIIMFAGLIGAIIILCIHIPGGLPHIWHTFMSKGPTDIVAKIPGIDGAESLWEKFKIYMETDVTFISVTLIVILGKLTSYGADQVMVQRYLSAKSLNDCKQGFKINTVAYILYTLLFTLLGMGLWVFFKSTPVLEKASYESVFPYFISHHMPVVLKGLLIAAVYSAGQSSVSAGLSAATTVIFTDFYMRLLKGKKVIDEALTPEEERSQVRFSRICTVILGSLTIGIAICIPYIGRLIEASAKLSGNFSGMIIPIFLLGMFTQRANSLGVAIGAVTGLIVLLWCNYARDLYFFFVGEYPKANWMGTNLGFCWVGIISFLVVIVVGYGISLLQKPPSKEKLQYRWAVLKHQEVEEN